MIKKMVFMIIALGLFFSFPVSPVRSAVLSSTRIAFVDIERVFNEYKGTKDAKKKVSEEVRKKREKIIMMEVAIRELEEKIAGEITTLTGLVHDEDIMTDEGYKLRFDTGSLKTQNSGVVGSTGAIEVAASTDAVKLSETEALAAKKKELEDVIQNVRESLLDTEGMMKERIMGHIYDVIREVAKEEGYCIVLNKEDVLFSEEESIDLTEIIIQKLNE